MVRTRKRPSAEAARAVLLLSVTYDPARTDPEALAGALDNVIQIGLAKCRDDLCADYGHVVVGPAVPSGHDPDYLSRLDYCMAVNDGACDPADAPELAMVVKEYGQGVSVTALDDRGERLGEVLLDYFHNRLKAFVYGRDDLEPSIAATLSDDVADDRRKRPRKGK